VVSLLLLIILFYALARRRRIRSGAARGPLFAVPWNRANNPPPPYPPGQGPPYGYPQQNHNTEYPPQNSWAPPAYKPEQTFTPVCERLYCRTIDIANMHLQPPGPPPGRTNLYSPVRMTVILYSVSNTPAATRSTTSCAYCGKYCCQSFIHMKLNYRLALELERLLSNHE
jgi:hypothetical protein